MFIRCSFLSLVFVLTFFLSLSAFAETGYVSDELIITLRQGKGNQYKILRTLKTGTPMEILEKGDMYYRVRTRGEVGYVLRQYVSMQTPKPVVIENLKREVEALREKIAQLEETRNEFRQKSTDLQKTLETKEKTLAQELADVQEKYQQTRQQLDSVTHDYSSLLESSENLISIIAERDQLTKEKEQLANRAEELKTENTDLLRTGVIKWFLAGSGVLFLGWILGKLSKKRRTGF